MKEWPRSSASYCWEGSCGVNPFHHAMQRWERMVGRLSDGAGRVPRCRFAGKGGATEGSPDEATPNLAILVPGWGSGEVALHEGEDLVVFSALQERVHSLPPAPLGIEGLLVRGVDKKGRNCQTPRLVQRPRAQE